MKEPTKAQIRNALAKAAVFFEENPSRWIKGRYVAKDLAGEEHFCMVGRVAHEAKVNGNVAAFLLANIVRNWAHSASESDPRYNDAKFGRSIALNDYVLSNPVEVAAFLRELKEFV